MGRWRTSVVVAWAIVLGLSACGSRLSRQQLLDDARGGVSGGAGGAVGAGSGLSGSGTGSEGPGAASGGIAAGGSTVAGSSSFNPSGGASGGGVSSSGGTTGGSQTDSGNGSAGGLSDGTGGRSTTCTGSKAAIIIGSVGEQSGIAGSAVADGPRGVAAWVASVNAAGGLNCHPVKYIVTDDGGDPSRNQSLTQQLVEQDGVIAMVQTDAPLAMQASYDYLNGKHIPVIGSEGAEDFFYTSPYFFPQHSSGTQMTYAVFAGFASVLNANQKAHLGLLDCIEAAQCSINGKQGPGVSQQLGLQIVYNAYASLTTPDFTSQCQAAKNAGVQVFFLSMDPNSIHRIARSCLSINFRPLYTTGVSVLVPTLSSDPNLDGLVGGVAVAPWMLAGNPAVAAYQAVVHKYAPGLTADNASMEGWVSAQLFQLAARSMPDQPTSQAVLQGLWMIRGNDLGGLTMPVTFTQGQDAPRTTCWFTVAIKSGQWTSPNNGARGCV